MKPLIEKTGYEILMGMAIDDLAEHLAYLTRLYTTKDQWLEYLSTTQKQKRAKRNAEIKAFRADWEEERARFKNQWEGELETTKERREKLENLVNGAV